MLRDGGLVDGHGFEDAGFFEVFGRDGLHGLQDGFAAKESAQVD